MSFVLSVQYYVILLDYVNFVLSANKSGIKHLMFLLLECVLVMGRIMGLSLENCKLLGHRSILVMCMFSPPVTVIPILVMGVRVIAYR